MKSKYLFLLFFSLSLFANFKVSEKEIENWNAYIDQYSVHSLKIGESQKFDSLPWMLVCGNGVYVPFSYSPYTEIDEDGVFTIKRDADGIHINFDVSELQDYQRDNFFDGAHAINNPFCPPSFDSRNQYKGLKVLSIQNKYSLFELIEYFTIVDEIKGEND
jgi:hypothetical protein|tara:strand:+ start:709 stop:1191 length:483 start_codon:yes stop_codon:yes gene_type:complete